jgi:hypothetical protein
MSMPTLRGMIFLSRKAAAGKIAAGSHCRLFAKAARTLAKMA